MKDQNAAILVIWTFIEQNVVYLHVLMPKNSYCCVLRNNDKTKILAFFWHLSICSWAIFWKLNTPLETQSRVTYVYQFSLKSGFPLERYRAPKLATEKKPQAH